MAKKKIIKINSNPNPSSPYDDNPYKQFNQNWRWNPETGQGEIDDTKPPKRKVKVDSNPVKGKTVIGPLARGAGQGGIAGLALGAISAYKQELADLARRKREIS